jgi:hypothetical protein
MSYLTIILAIWAICAICAILFVRGAALRDELATPSPKRDARRGVASNEVGHTA